MTGSTTTYETGELLERLMQVADVIVLAKGEDEITLTVSRTDGTRHGAWGATLQEALADALRLENRRRCGRCEQRKGATEFSPGDRFCLACRRKLATIRRGLKKARRAAGQHGTE
jgi:hypothetical protein